LFRYKFNFLNELFRIKMSMKVFFMMHHKKNFIKNAALIWTAMFGLHQFARAWDNEPKLDAVMPVLFVGHGSPMNAIEQNKFSKIWRGLAKKINNSKSDYGSIGPLETVGTKVAAMKIRAPYMTSAASLKRYTMPSIQR